MAEHGPSRKWRLAPGSIRCPAQSRRIGRRPIVLRPDAGFGHPVRRREAPERFERVGGGGAQPADAGLGQWAAHKGATVIGVVGNAAKIDHARKNGCAHVIDGSREDFAARVRDLTGGKGVDVVYDSVGQSSWTGSLQSLKPRGIMVSFGQASGPVPALQVGQLGTLGSLFLTRPSLFHYIPTQHELLQRATQLFLAFKSGAVKTPTISGFALRDAAAAHAALEGRQTVGKVILTV